MKHDKYVAPAMEIIPVDPGGVMAISTLSGTSAISSAGGGGNFMGSLPTGGSSMPSAGGGGNFTGTSAGTRAASRDIEDLINDILTVGQ